MAEPLLTAIEERNEIKRIKDAEEMVRGDVWYVLDAKWWESWMEYTNFNAEEETKESGGPRPGAILNEALQAPDAPPGVLKPALRENEDMVYCSEPRWRLLEEWYGGGPAFPRNVITVGVMEEARLDLYPQPCRVWRAGDDGEPAGESVVAFLSRTSAQPQMLAQLCAKLRVAPDKTRLWVKIGGSAKWVLLATTHTMDEIAGDDSETKVLVETQDGGGWKRAEPAGDPEDTESDEESKGRSGGDVVDDIPSWRGSLKVGDRCDAQDTEGKWYESVVIDANPEDNSIKVHFRGWEARWDSWFKLTSEKLQPRFTKVKNFRDFRVNDKVEMKLDTRDGPRWFEGNVTSIKAQEKRVRVKCVNKFRNDEEWYDYDTENLCALGTHCVKAARERTIGYSNFGFRSHTAGRPEIEGAVGLVNLGNTCFMNSMLQCLSNTEPLTEWFLGDVWRKDINMENPLGHGGRLAEAYAAMIGDMWSGEFRVVCPTELKKQIGIYAPQFAGFQQQDSQELMSFLLDGLHEDCNRVLKKEYVETIEGDGRPDAVVAREAWEGHLKRNKSHILDVFGGQLRSHVSCDNCDRESITFDPFLSFSVPVPYKQERDLVFTVFPYDGSVPTQYKARVPKSGVVLDMKNWLRETEGVEPTNIIMADVYGSRVHEWLGDRSPVSKIRDRDFIFGFLVPDVPGLEDVKEGGKEGKESKGLLSRMGLGGWSGRTTTYEDKNRAGVVQMLYRKPGRDGRSRVVEPFGEPRVLSLHSLGGGPGKMPTNNEVRAEVLRCIRRMLKSPEGAEGSGSGAAGGADASDALPAEGDAPEGGSGGGAGAVGGGGGGAGDWTADDTPYTLQVGESGGFSVGTPVPADDEPFKCNTNTQALYIDFTTESFAASWSSDAMRQVNMSKSMDGSAGRADVNLHDCLVKAFEREQLGENDKWYCSKCKDHRQAFKKFDLWKLPEVLVVHLKRFQYSQGAYFVHRDKISCLVDFPMELDLAEFTMGPKDTGTTYDLYAISNHAGGMGGGHYTAFAKNFRNGVWYDFNDSSVHEADEDRLVTAYAYVLFYRRRKNGTGGKGGKGKSS